MRPTSQEWKSTSTAGSDRSECVRWLDKGPRGVRPFFRLEVDVRGELFPAAYFVHYLAYCRGDGIRRFLHAVARIDYYLPSASRQPHQAGLQLVYPNLVMFRCFLFETGRSPIPPKIGRAHV